MISSNFRKIAFAGLALLGLAGVARAEGWETAPPVVLERTTPQQAERRVDNAVPDREASRQTKHGVFGHPRPDLLRELAGE